MDHVLSPERREYIDNIAYALASIYSTKSGIDFDLMARDLGVTFSDFDCIIYATGQKDGKPCIYSPKYATPCVKKYGLAHEFGHLILKSSGGTKLSEDEEEKEVDYFVTKLGIKCPPTFLTVLDLLWAFWRNRKSIVNHVKSTDKETGRRLIKDRKNLVNLLTDEEFSKK